MTECPYNLPMSWQWLFLSDVLKELESGGRPHGGVRQFSKGIPSIGGEHLNEYGGFRRENVRYVPESFYRSMSKGKIRKSDILLVKDGATTGKVSLVDDDFPYSQAAVNEHVFIIRGNPEIIDQRFLFRFLFSLQGQNQIKDKFQGTAQGGINSTFADNFPIPIPSLTEQAQIVSKIEEILRETRAARLSLQKVPLLIKQFRQILLLSAFTGRNYSELSPGLADSPKRILLPNDWLWTTLDDLLDQPLKNGKSALPSKSGKGVPVLKLSAITFKDFGLSNVKICDLKDNEVKDLWVQTGDILISRSNTLEYVGLAALYEGPVLFVFPDLMIRVRVKRSLIVPKFLSFYLDCPISRAYFQSVAGGTAGSMPKINQRDILDLPVPLPPLTQQNNIVLALEELLDKSNTVENLTAKVKTQIDRIVESTLNCAFHGELFRKDTNDEPSSALLGYPNRLPMNETGHTSGKSSTVPRQIN